MEENWGVWLEEAGDSTERQGDLAGWRLVWEQALGEERRHWMRLP